MYVKMMIDSQTSLPFSAAALPPPKPPEVNFKEEARKLSRETYGTDVMHVEEKIRMWMTRQFNLGIAIAEQKRNANPTGVTSKVSPEQPQMPVDANHR